MAGSLPFLIARRLVAVVLIALAASSLTFLTLHGLFPETFSDIGRVAHPRVQRGEDDVRDPVAGDHEHRADDH